MPGEIWLVRHGETEWSRSGAQTGRTDLPLTEAGREAARSLGRRLEPQRFVLVLTSPRQRARETCELAGFGAHAEVEPNLAEWDYGDYEGKSTEQIRAQSPNWSIWTSGVPHGETIEQVASRAQRVIRRTAEAQGDVVLFAHGHILRILTACWLGLPPDAGRFFALGTATVSKLGYERETRVITQWNAPC